VSRPPENPLFVLSSFLIGLRGINWYRAKFLWMLPGSSFNSESCRLRKDFDLESASTAIATIGNEYNEVSSVPIRRHGTTRTVEFIQKGVGCFVALSRRLRINSVILSFARHGKGTLDVTR
jgi:hypothetical protein